MTQYNAYPHILLSLYILLYIFFTIREEHYWAKRRDTLQTIKDRILEALDDVLLLPQSSRRDKIILDIQYALFACSVKIDQALIAIGK